MNYGELRSTFTATLNNDECTDALADQFITQGITRVDRVLRTPIQKALVEQTIDDTFEYYTLPADYLALDWIKVNGRPTYRIASSIGNTLPEDGDTSDTSEPGSIRFWTENEKVYFSPALADGDVLKVNYYSTLDEASSDADTTQVTSVIPDVILYASLIFAAIYFLDERQGQFDGMYKELLSEVQLQAELDELSSSVIHNPYEGLI